MTRLGTASEHQIQQAIATLLVRLGFLTIRCNSGAMVGEATATSARRFVQFVKTDDPHESVADILAVSKTGIVVAVECKRPGVNLNPSPDARGEGAERIRRQRRFLDRINARGGLGIFASDVSDVLDALRERGLA